MNKQRTVLVEALTGRIKKLGLAGLLLAGGMWLGGLGVGGVREAYGQNPMGGIYRQLRDTSKTQAEKDQWQRNADFMDAAGQDWTTDEKAKKLQESVDKNNQLLEEQNRLLRGEGKSGTASSYEAQPKPSRPQAGAQTCFIATAAYGMPWERNVVKLRCFRERYLLTHALGSRFVDCYYRTSPPVARFIAEKPWAQFVTRLALTPLVVLAGAMLGDTTDAAWLTLAMIGMAVFVMKRRLQPESPINDSVQRKKFPQLRQST